MLKHTEKTNTPNCHGMLALETATYDFYLTGSRYIGGSTAHSDWDFVAEYSPELEAFLLLSGFVESPKFNKKPGFNDGHTKAVYEWYYDGTTVQVQVTKHLKAKLSARDAIYNNGILYNWHLTATTAQRIQLWRTLCLGLDATSPEVANVMYAKQFVNAQEPMFMTAVGTSAGWVNYNSFHVVASNAVDMNSIVYFDNNMIYSK